MDLRMSTNRNGECGVSSRQFLGKWGDREDGEKMVGKGERCYECCNAFHGDLGI